MKKILFILFSISSLFADQRQLVQVNEQVEIWFEAFGQKEDPACLLIMGAGGPGIFWPNDFCEKLAEKGFYVIRYDHRDTGYSTCFNFEQTPYTLADLAKDGMDLLDALQIERAHLVGLSMGGPLAELLSIRDPERIQSIALIATSSDFRPLNLALAGSPPEEGALSGPAESYRQAVAQLLQNPAPETEGEQIIRQMALWKILNGNEVPLDEEKNREIQEQYVLRLQNSAASSFNHMYAIRNSEELVRNAPGQVSVPVVIFQGTEDPIFGSDHGEALAAAIQEAQYYSVAGMGHVLNPTFSDFIIDKIEQNANRAINKKH